MRLVQSWSVFVGALVFAYPAFASEVIQDPGKSITIEKAASLLHYSGGGDRMRAETAPNYSEELGFSMKAAVGGYLTEEFALGLIVEYGERKREYLANAGMQFTDMLSLVGTIGLLEEHNEYVDGEGREKVQQLEYGASLKGAYEAGILSGFELNGYLASADADSDSVETGRLHGVQFLAELDLSATTRFKLGGGYEWLEWDDTNEDDGSWTLSAEAAQQLADKVRLTGYVKRGASEFVYGGGLAFDLSNGGLNTNSLALKYSYIDGRGGIEGDQRVELSWTVGFGAGVSTSSAAADLAGKSATIRPAADVATVLPANNLLSDVMRRPDYLPQRVLARAKKASPTPLCNDIGITFYRFINQIGAENVIVLNDVNYPNPKTIEIYPLDVGGFDMTGATASIASTVYTLSYVPPSGPVPAYFSVTGDLVYGQTYDVTITDDEFICHQELTVIGFS